MKDNSKFRQKKIANKYKINTVNISKSESDHFYAKIKIKLLNARSAVSFFSNF